MSLEQMLIDWTPTFVIMTIIIAGLISYYKIRTNYKKDQMKVINKEEKKKESFEGAIGSLLNDAPKNLKQIESEIATIEEKGRRENLPKEQISKLTERLRSERDMLNIAVKYGDLAKPLVKPIGTFVNKILGGIGR